LSRWIAASLALLAMTGEWVGVDCRAAALLAMTVLEVDSSVRA